MTDESALIRAWGNPGKQTFRKRFIRQVAAATTTAQTHIELVDVFAGMFNEAAGAGVELPARAEAWQPATDGTALVEANFGIAVAVVPGLASIASGWGFDEEDGWLVFRGDPETAKALAEKAETARVLDRVGAEEKIPGQVYFTGRPGEREIRLGDTGDDVQFFKMVYNAPDQDTTFDDWCVGLARHIQDRMGIRVTGTVTEDLWKATLPTVHNYNIGTGDSGHIVRVLQAVLYAYDWDAEVIVTGRFDSLTHKAVRALQSEYGLRLTPNMSGAEWAILLGIRPGETRATRVGDSGGGDGDPA